MSSGPRTQTTTGSSSGTSTTNQEQHSKINEWFAPFWMDLAKGASKALGQVSNKPYPGPFVAQAMPAEYAAAHALQNFAGGMLPSLMSVAGNAAGQAFNPKLDTASDAAIRLGTQQLRGKYLDPNNPILTGAISAATSPVMALANSQINRAMNTASAQGATGNSLAMGPVQMLINQATAQSGDLAAKIMYDWMSRERMIQQNSPQLVAAGAGLSALPAGIINNALQGVQSGVQMLGRGGELERQLNQLGITNSLAAFQEGQTAPFRPYFPYAQLLGAIPTLTTDSTGKSTTDFASQSTQTTTLPQPSPIVGALQGAFGGSSLMQGMLGPATLAANPWLPFLGGAAGAIGGSIWR